MMGIHYDGYPVAESFFGAPNEFMILVELQDNR